MGWIYCGKQQYQSLYIVHVLHVQCISTVREIEWVIYCVLKYTFIKSIVIYMYVFMVQKTHVYSGQLVDSAYTCTLIAYKFHIYNH